MELGSSAAWLETRDNGQKAKQETPQEWECLLAQRTVGQWIRSPVISEYGGKDPKNQVSAGSSWPIWKLKNRPLSHLNFPISL